MSVYLHSLSLPKAKVTADLLRRLSGNACLATNTLDRLELQVILHTDLVEGDEQIIEDFFMALGAVQVAFPFPQAMHCKTYLGSCTADIDTKALADVFNLAYDGNVLVKL